MRRAIGGKQAAADQDPACMLTNLSWSSGKGKTSYLDSVGQSNCNSEVEQAEPQDTDKTLG